LSIVCAAFIGFFMWYSKPAVVGAVWRRLLEVVMQERDQAKCDELSEEIWRVLEELEAIKEVLTERE
jgi:hypothetical protein